MFREVVGQSVTWLRNKKNRKKDGSFYVVFGNGHSPSPPSASTIHEDKLPTLFSVILLFEWKEEVLPIFASKVQGIGPKPNDCKEALSYFLTHVLWSHWKRPNVLS